MPRIQNFAPIILKKEQLKNCIKSTIEKYQKKIKNSIFENSNKFELKNQIENEIDKPLGKKHHEVILFYLNLKKYYFVIKEKKRKIKYVKSFFFLNIFYFLIFNKFLNTPFLFLDAF